MNRPPATTAIVRCALLLTALWLSAAGPAVPANPAAAPPSVIPLSSGGPGGNNSSGPPRLNYTVTFVEQGLAPGTNWSVSLGGIARATTASTLAFPNVPEGNVSYHVSSPPGYAPAPVAGTLYVSGPLSIAVLFNSTRSSATSSPWPIPPIELVLLAALAGGGAASVLGLERRARRRAVDPEAGPSDPS